MRCASATWILIAAITAGCGRLGFDDSPLEQPPEPDAGSLEPDAGSGSVIVPAPLHHYRFEGDLADEKGGPELISLGGTLDSDGYRFPTNLGLERTAGMPASVYTIDLKLSLDDMTYWRKIIDFKGRMIDHGLYANLSTLSFVETVNPDTVHKSPPVLVAGQRFQVTLTRNDDGVVTAYLEGVRQFAFTDTGGIATFTEGGRAVFATDDTVNAEPEACSGILRELRVWNTALTEAQVGEL